MKRAIKRGGTRRGRAGGGAGPRGGEGPRGGAHNNQPGGAHGRGGGGRRGWGGRGRMEKMKSKIE